MFLLREMKSRRQVLEDDCNSNATEEVKDEKRPGNSFLAICYVYVIREKITLYRLPRWRGCVDHSAVTCDRIVCCGLMERVSSLNIELKSLNENVTVACQTFTWMTLKHFICMIRILKYFAYW